MTEIPNLKYREVGNIYRVRAWVEYRFKQSRGKRPAACELECIQARSAGKSELGWADFRVMHFSQIAKWWELVMSAYLLVFLHHETFNASVTTVADKFRQHDWWDEGSCWKNLLNNLRLILQSSVSFNLILRWLKVFPIPQLSLGFPRLISLMDGFDCLFYFVYLWDDFYYSSA